MLRTIISRPKLNGELALPIGSLRAMAKELGGKTPISKIGFSRRTVNNMIGYFVEEGQLGKRVRSASRD